MGVEFPIERAVCDWAEANGWHVRKLKWEGRRGAPDRLFVKDGRVVFIEFKKPTVNPESLLSGNQSKEIRLLKEHGAEVHVVASIGTAKNILCEKKS